MLIVADLTQDALVPLDLGLLRHLREHLVLIEAQLGCELLDQENVGVCLRTLARVDPVKLHREHLSLKLYWPEAFHLVGKLVAIVHVRKAAQLLSIFISQWFKCRLQLNIARVEERRLLVCRLVAAKYLLISADVLVLQMRSILVADEEKKLVVGNTRIDQPVLDLVSHFFQHITSLLIVGHLRGLDHASTLLPDIEPA